ncbi:MAG: hypothetical protein ACTSPO_15650, partial [Candidatus Heimdallarchaeaceae archaeon]
AKNLLALSDIRDERSKEFHVKTLFQILQDPENIKKIIQTRRGLAKAQGLLPKEAENVEAFEKKFDEDPEGTLAKLEQRVAFLAPARYKAYKEALKGTDKKTADITNLEYWENLKKTDPDLADTFALATGFTKDDKEKSTAAMKNFNHYIDLLNTDPEQAKLFGDSINISRVTPHSDLAKLRTDLNNKLVTPKEYEKKRDKILNPTMKNKTELTMAALRGDAEAKAVLEEMNRDNIEQAELRSEATTTGKLAGLYGAMDLDAVANAIITGEETIDHVHNTFGVPIQEVVRKKVLAIEPDFNFVQPRAIEKSLSSSLVQQQKNRGAMGNFVLNINGQLDKVSEIMSDVIKRIGVRALDMPFRELHVKFKGSGHERVLEAYMKEISVEIFKLSQGSTASVALLPEKGREEWERIHDFNLSYPQLKIVLEGTKDMANIRMKSVNDEIKATVENLTDVRENINLYSAEEGKPGAEFENTITVTNPDTGKEEIWDLNTEKRIR